MNTSINQRIKQVIEKYNISITALSNRIDIVQTTLNRQLSGETSSIPVSTIEAILHYFSDVSAEWLLRGEGSMLKSENGETSNNGGNAKLSFYVDKNGFLKLKQ